MKIKAKHYSVFITYLVFLVGSFQFFSPGELFAEERSDSEVSAAPGLMAKGLESFKKGSFEQAVLDWEKATELYKSAENLEGQIDALTNLAAAYHALGQYKLAIGTGGTAEGKGVLEIALELAENLGDRERTISVLSSLGSASIFTRQSERAAPYLEKSLAMAREDNNLQALPVILNNLGNLLAAQGDHSEALEAYQETTDLARRAGNLSLFVKATVNAAFSAAVNGSYEDATELNRQALNELLRLDTTYEKAYLLITMGQTAQYILQYEKDIDSRKELLLHAQDVYTEAIEVAEAIGDRRAASYALGYLGHLYEIDGQPVHALQLTREAVFLAQQLQLPDALYRWQWQTGRLLQTQGQTEVANLAYRRAVETLQSIRHDVAIAYGNRNLRSSFREAVGSLYYELADLLLQRADSVDDENEVQKYLIEARDTVELLRSAELEDYFQDDCVNLARARQEEIEGIDPNTAVVYVIPLRDRTELLLGFSDGLKRFKADVGSEELTNKVRQFRYELEDRTTFNYFRNAQQLYNWLVRPLEEELKSRNIDTLVFVPDGALRSIPMAALHDGENFLISKYAVAVSPGLTLMEPKPISREKVQLLMMGLSEAVQGYPALPFVPLELKELESIFGGKKLENQEFLVNNFKEEVMGKIYSIVHIASHGEFKGDATETFILAYDDKLSLNDLEQYIKPSLFRGDPIELLTLSACQTAVGDDRAALGLAGVAIKAGARSALATLWSVNDEASSQLISEFYVQLKKDLFLSKARALQKAQQKILNQRCDLSRFFCAACQWLRRVLGAQGL